MPQFVLLRHDCPNGDPRPSHWDLMLEHEGVLWTWALESLPAEWEAPVIASASDGGAHGTEIGGCKPTTAERLADHRLGYLNYEGPIRGGRGNVRRCCRGSFRFTVTEADRVVAEFTGPLEGKATLDRDRASPSRWQLSWDGTPGDLSATADV